MNREAAIEAGARAAAQSIGLNHDRLWWISRRRARELAAAVIDAAAPHLTPDVETIAATLALAYGGHVSPPRGGRDWKAAEAVLALLLPEEEA